MSGRLHSGLWSRSGERCTRGSAAAAGEMRLRRGGGPLLLAVTCVCFSAGSPWSYQQEEDASDGSVPSDTGTEGGGTNVYFASKVFVVSFAVEAALTVTFLQRSTPA